MSEVPARHEDRAGERAWRALPAGTRAALERGLPPTDLHTLLIAVARKRVGRVSAADVMRRWQAEHRRGPLPGALALVRWFLCCEASPGPRDSAWP
jgi:hypothetical protein